MRTRAFTDVGCSGWCSAAIRRELQLFADELALEVAAFPVVRGWPADDRRMYAGLVAELLEADAGERAQLQRRTVEQMRLVSLAIPARRPSR